MLVGDATAVGVAGRADRNRPCAGLGCVDGGRLGGSVGVNGGDCSDEGEGDDERTDDDFHGVRLP